MLQLKMFIAATNTFNINTIFQVFEKKVKYSIILFMCILGRFTARI